MRTLANIVSLQDLPKSSVIALTDSRGARGARDLAEALAELSAQQGYRTVLVYADNDASQPADGAGFNDALADSSLVHNVLKDGAVESLKILPAGSVVADRYSLMTRERIVAVLDELRTGADTIVVVAPSIAETTETQLVCAAADLTMLVVTRGSSRAGDVTSAAEALADAHAVLLGAVLIDGTERQPTRSDDPPASQTPSPPASTPATRRPDRTHWSHGSPETTSRRVARRGNSLKGSGVYDVVAGVRSMSRAGSAPMTGSDRAWIAALVGGAVRRGDAAPIFATIVLLVATFFTAR